MQGRRSSTFGFKRTGRIVSGDIRRVGESRGFAVSRLLTHWAEITGQDVAAVARPIKVSYGKAGPLGATLTLLTTDPHAPMLEMQREALRCKINAVYGYNAIARIRITQTAPMGFEGGQGRAGRSGRGPAGLTRTSGPKCALWTEDGPAGPVS